MANPRPGRPSGGSLVAIPGDAMEKKHRIISGERHPPKGRVMRRHLGNGEQRRYRWSAGGVARTVGARSSARPHRRAGGQARPGYRHVRYPRNRKAGAEMGKFYRPVKSVTIRLVRRAGVVQARGGKYPNHPQPRARDNLLAAVATKYHQPCPLARKRAGFRIPLAQPRKDKSPNSLSPPRGVGSAPSPRRPDRPPLPMEIRQ